MGKDDPLFFPRIVRNNRLGEKHVFERLVIDERHKNPGWLFLRWVFLSFLIDSLLPPTDIKWRSLLFSCCYKSNNMMRVAVPKVNVIDAHSTCVPSRFPPPSPKNFFLFSVLFPNLIISSLFLCVYRKVFPSLYTLLLQDCIPKSLYWINIESSTFAFFLSPKQSASYF